MEARAERSLVEVSVAVEVVVFLLLRGFLWVEEFGPTSLARHGCPKLNYRYRVPVVRKIEAQTWHSNMG